MQLEKNSLMLEYLNLQHRGAAAGIVFHPHNPSLMATVGHDGVVRCVDVRVGGGGQQKGGVLKSIQTDAPLTCGSFHHEVGAWGGAAEAPWPYRPGRPRCS